MTSTSMYMFFMTLFIALVYSVCEDDEHDPDWQHGLDHGGFKSDGDGMANDPPLTVNDELLHEFSNEETTRNPEWEHGNDHGGFMSDGDGEANNGPLKADDVLLHKLANRETTH